VCDLPWLESVLWCCWSVDAKGMYQVCVCVLNILFCGIHCGITWQMPLCQKLKVKVSITVVYFDVNKNDMK